MMLGCEELSGITLSGAIDRVLTARICSVVRCDDSFLFSVTAPSVEIALFKVVAAGVITPAKKNGETITFITMDSRTSLFLALRFIT